ncbi:replication protein RepA [Glutamicibacter arilaitensis]|uniref:replication protein RepA n=1 Tax=Glutamicibacter arilaitensis TaxID=256701 RepID=UPI003FD0AC97
MEYENNAEGKKQAEEETTSADALAKLNRTAHAITAKGLIDSGSKKLTVCPWWLSSVCLPYRNPIRKGQGPEVWERVNGSVRFTVLPARARGKQGAEAREFPYGVWPRLILIWLAQQVTIMGEDIGNLRLPNSFDEFARQVGLGNAANHGGKAKTLCIEQIKRLLHSTITIDSSVEEELENGQSREYVGNFHLPIGSMNLVINKVNGEIEDIEWGAPIKLTPQFIESVQRSRFPIYKEAIKAFSKAPLQLDIYLFLVARLYTPVDGKQMPTTRITWEQLFEQFGGHHSRLRDFRRDFIKGLEAVKEVYKTARVEATTQYLILKPSRNHIPERERAQVEPGASSMAGQDENKEELPPF